MSETSLILAEPIELVITNTTERIDIRTRDADGDAADATELLLTIQDLNGKTLHKDGYPEFELTGTVTVAAAGTSVVGTGTLFLTELVEGDEITIDTEDLIVASVESNTALTLETAHVAGATDETATKTTRIVKPATTTGHYYFQWGDLAAPVNADGQAETDSAQDVIFLWQAVIGSDTEQRSKAQTVRMVTPKVFAMLHPLRDLIDKSRKMVSEDPDEPCFLGYTDAQLMEYLIGGLHYINTYEPYPTWCTLDNYPSQLFGHLLYESALVAGVMSQQLFAIDTDIPNYSDQGNSFVIQHGPQLAAFLNVLTQRLDKLVPLMKLKFVNSGSLHIEAGPNYRLTQLVQAAPTGSLFRNMWFR